MVQRTPVDTQRAHLGAQLCGQVLATDVPQVRGLQRGCTTGEGTAEGMYHR
jgi:hypothetical protein